MSPPDAGAAPQPPAARRPTAIYGGAFDPVTKAHLAVADLVASRGYRLVFMPCADAHVFGKRMFPAIDRVALLRLAVGDRYEVSLMEIEDGSSRAADTWPKAVERYGPVHWVIGSDNAACMHRWHDGARLIRQLPFIVIGRDGHPLPASGEWCLSPPHQFLSADLNGSSSQAREAILNRRWEDAALLLSAPVLDQIRKRGWYSGDCREIQPIAP
ncbi:MAG TPA: hypothetical protein VGA56_19955 [Opitutaceae bacterium]